MLKDSSSIGSVSRKAGSIMASSCQTPKLSSKDLGCSKGLFQIMKPSVCLRYCLAEQWLREHSLHPSIKSLQRWRVSPSVIEDDPIKQKRVNGFTHAFIYQRNGVYFDGHRLIYPPMALVNQAILQRQVSHLRTYLFENLKRKAGDGGIHDSLARASPLPQFIFWWL